MQTINNSEEVLNPLSSLIKGLNVIDIEKLTTEDIFLINKNIDDYNSFFTTQQAEFVDYNNFSEHVFFDSAVNKVIFAFNRILNFPYDENEYSYKQYINSLEGYTGHIYRKVFPKNLSFLRLDGQQKILIKNLNGAFLNDHDNPEIGTINPDGRFSFNFWLRSNTENFTNNQVVFKFYNVENNSGFICFLSFDNNNLQKYYINFLIVNDQEYKIEKTEFDINNFSNITINITTINNKREISFLINGNKVENSESGSDAYTQMSSNSFHNSLEEISTEFIIGNSENIVLNLDNNVYSFTNFKGDIDDFRFYHKIKSIKETKREMHKNVFSQEGLKIYLKFNEPGGEYLNSYVCLDSSGNKLHGLLLNNDNQIIEDTINYKISSNTPLKLERDDLSPVINSSFKEILTIRESLLNEATSYDKNNKNLVFNLMPKHYFLEAGDLQGLPIFSNNDTIQIKKIDENFIKYLYQPDTNTFKAYQPANTHFVNLMIIWARFFDELKIMLDSISYLVDIDYDSLNNKKILGIKIPLICKLYGLDFVEIFSSITKRKQNKEALHFEDIVSDISIRKIQNEIWYKILINSQSFLRSKGTINSIENLFSSIGLSSSDNISIRKYSNVNNIENKNDQFIETKTRYIGTSFVNIKSLNYSSTFEENSSFSNEKPYIEILNLKNINKDDDEVYKHYKVSNDNINNGLGENFSIEMFFKFENIIFEKKNIDSVLLGKNITSSSFKSIQNILRLDYFKSPVLNVFFARKNLDSKYFDLNINIKPVINSYSYNFNLLIENIDIFDRENYFCITQLIENNNITYTAYCSKANSNLMNETIKKTSQTKNIINFNSDNLFSNKDNLNLRIGEYFYDDTTSELFSLDDTDFQGEILSIRTWSKCLNDKEIDNHSKNIKNISEENISKSSLVNNFFLKKETDQEEIKEENNIKYFVITNNSIYKKLDDNESINECRFNSKSNIDLKSFARYNEFLIKNKNIEIDAVNTQNFVNIGSFSEEKNKLLGNNYNEFPSTSMPYDFDYNNENRLSIDFSVAKALNDDISRIILDINAFDELLFNNSKYNFYYKSFENINKDYFNRLKDDKLMNYSSLANVFRYFDNILSSLLASLIPSKTKFQGFNLVYESHVLERHKYQYKNSDSRISTYYPSESYSFSRNIKKTYRDANYNNNRSMIKYDPS